MASVRHPVDKVARTPPPDVLAGLNVAERGFSNTCGTALTHQRPGWPFAAIAGLVSHQCR